MTELPAVPGLLLRDAAAGDQPFLDALYDSTRDDLRHAGLEPALAATLIKMQQQVHEHGQRSTFPHARQLLLEQSGEALGRVVLDTDARHGMRVVDIALLPHARGRGHGSAVLLALQERAAALDMPLRLRVAKDNEGARRLYAALGFRLEAGGEALDELVWRAGSAT